MKKQTLFLGLACSLVATAALADERLFTYTYEPRTPPKGEREFEQSVTLRAGRTGAVGQEDFARVELRSELEYGVTDKYQVSLYFNQQYDHFNDPATGDRTRHFEQTGFSMENIFQVVNPRDHKVGVALYLEPTWNGSNCELEEKILIGQRYEQWRWALNFTHATEWTRNFAGKEGEFETSFGVARQLNARWSIGLEARDHNELPEYREWQNTALYLGPVVNYKRQSWFATLSVMPQIYGANFTGNNPDHNPHLELEGHEKLNVRLIFGFDF
ncbi:MAG: hypothetical protein RLZZ350_947 [Verrucomicrobiota bacterium]